MTIRQKPAETSGLSPAEVTGLCSGNKSMAELDEEIRSKLAKTLDIPIEKLLALKPSGMTYMMVYGEALAALYAGAARNCPPEEILTKDHLAELFLSIADRYGREDKKRAYYETWYQEGGGAPLSEFICGNVFNIRKNRDLHQKYET